METITVKVLPSCSSSYEVRIGSRILSSELVSTLSGGRRVFVVSDANVQAAGHLTALNKYDMYIVSPPGERSKNIQTVTEIIEQMELKTYGRDSVIVGIGGGTVGDMAGFAAAIFKRGIPVIHIPTTTVSQADSSIGGKTGVDSTMSKNAYGCFWQPSAVLIDVNTLKTLDDRQYLSGLVESLKHALIADKKYFDYISDNIEQLLARDQQVLCELARRNCRIKASVTEKDPNEKNLRRILNYGHTIGHSVETLSGYSLYHGECVAIGLVGASLIEQRLGLGSNERTEAIKNILNKLSQPTAIPNDCDINQIIDLLSRDKKAVQGKPMFALIEEIGSAYQAEGQWAHRIEVETIRSVLTELYEG